MLRKFVWVVPVLSMLIVGCGGSDDDPTIPTAPSTPPPTGPASLELTNLQEGTGAEAVANSVAIVHYTLWLYDPAGTDSKGTRVEGSRDRNQPYSFAVGTNAVIPGFDQSVSGMRVGGIRRAIVPPSLAYGSSGSGNIAPNSWLVFEIELLAITT